MLRSYHCVGLFHSASEIHSFVEDENLLALCQLGLSAPAPRERSATWWGSHAHRVRDQCAPSGLAPSSLTSLALTDSWERNVQCVYW